MSHLIVLRGLRSGERYLLDNFPVLVGRDPQATISLPDPSLAPFHIRIKQRGRLYIIEDLSDIGLYLNGERVRNSILENLDRILLGDVEIIFSQPWDQLHFVGTAITSVPASELSPISLSHSPLPQFTRITDQQFIHNQIQNIQKQTKIYEAMQNVIAMEAAEDAAISLLRNICQDSPNIQRAAFFVWKEKESQLIPMATLHMSENKAPFHIHEKNFMSVLERKQGLQVKYPDKENREVCLLLFPMIFASTLISIIQVELESGKTDPQKEDPSSIQTLINYCASHFEALLLRVEIDVYTMAMVEAIVATLEAKDTYTVGHSERVCTYSLAIADELGLKRETKKLLLLSAICHDIGKIGIPDVILKKASILTAEEYEEMKLHPTIGAAIIEKIPNARRFISGIRNHHEKWDGTGYPDHLAGEEIPFFARIIAIADVFDAMSSGRSYSGFMNESDAVDRIQQERELFDPDILQALVRAWEKGTITQRTSTLQRK